MDNTNKIGMKKLPLIKGIIETEPDLLNAGSRRVVNNPIGSLLQAIAEQVLQVEQLESEQLTNGRKTLQHNSNSAIM